jgi:hypothetical protein
MFRIPLAQSRLGRIRRPGRVTLWGISLLLGTVAFVLRAVHLGRSWEIFIDEITYLRISQSVADSLQVKLYGDPFYLHPPLFFFFEGAYVKLFNPSNGLIQQIYDVRYLNIVFASLSAIVLFGLGRRLAGWPAGVAAATIFALDPFIIKMNSRNVLETSAYLWVLLGYYIIVSALGDKLGAITTRRVLAAGFLFGLALLTKDMTAFVTLLPLAVCFTLNWALPRRQSALAGATVALVYAQYPVVIYIVGDWSSFTYQKLRGASRLAGFVQETGFNQQGGPSFLEAIISNLGQFATTYALLGSGTVAVCVLFFFGGAARRVVVAWTASAYALLAYGVGVGTLEEQFFYFLIIPSLLATVVAATLVLKISAIRDRRQQWLLRGTTFLAAVFVGWSGTVWAQVHFTPDNGYERVVAYLNENVPKGSRIASTTDTSDFMLDGYVVGKWNSVEELHANDAEYVLINSYLVEKGYGIASPEFYQWVARNSELAYGFEGRSHGLIGLYQLLGSDTSETPTDALAAPPQTAASKIPTSIGRSEEIETGQP